MNECKIWCRKPLKKVTTMVASEEVAKFIAIVALSETVALEIALWERTRWQIWELRWFYPWTDKYLETKHWIHDAVSVWIGMNHWTLKIHQESKKCWLVVLCMKALMSWPICTQDMENHKWSGFWTRYISDENLCHCNGSETYQRWWHYVLVWQCMGGLCDG